MISFRPETIPWLEMEEKIIKAIFFIDIQFLLYFWPIDNQKIMKTKEWQQQDSSS